MARVVIENLSKVFKGPAGEAITAVRDINLTIEEKEFLVLVGPSGCGKSTTLRLIAGLEEITSGTITIDGQVVNELPPKDRDLAMVFQNYALYPHMTVFENMAFGLKLRKVPKPEIQSRVRQAAEVLGLMPYLDRKPQTLSGGERQRVAVGRAMARQPKVFLFDEPLSNLDPAMRAQTRAEISRLHARLGATILYVTHDQIEAMTMGDRIAVMNRGMIQQVGPPMALYDKPCNLFVAGFIGSPPMNFFKGELIQKGGAVFFVESPAARISEAAYFTLPIAQNDAARLSSHIGRAVVLGLRSEHIKAAPPFSAPIRPENSLIAAVELVERLGWETHLHLASGGHAFTARVPAAGQIAAAQTLTAEFDLSQAHFFDPQTELAIALS